MSILLASVDEVRYDSDTDILYVDGWLVQEGDTPMVLFYKIGQAKTQVTDMERKARPDIANVLRETRLPKEPGYSFKIPQISEKVESLDSLEILVRQGTAEKVLASYTREALKNEIMNEAILFNIDEIGIVENQVELKGWAIGKKEAPVLKVLDAQGQPVPCEILRLAREDVRIAFEELVEKGEEIGFRIRIAPAALRTKEGILRMSTPAAAKEYVIPKARLLFENTVWGRTWNVIKPQMWRTHAAYIRENGRATFFKQLRKDLVKEFSEYDTWAQKQKPSKSVQRAQKKRVFGYAPCISIVMPLYNTPLDYLEEMIESIRTQTYTNWELCMADGSSVAEVGELITRKYKKDRRIKYQKLEKNLGISENTNAAVAMASGDFIMLSDHDDIIEQGALYEIVSAIHKHPEAAILYTDEDKVTMDGLHYFEPHFKPDFNLRMLESNNYICHIFVVKKSVMQAVGGFQSKYDGAQDYDMILRCCEQVLSDPVQEICHIPKVLYHWRSHPNSTAANADSKGYALDAGKSALEAHYERLGIAATVSTTRLPGRYRTEFALQGTPKISIIIPNKDHVEDLKLCLDSVYEKTTYKNFEILIVENNSEEPATFAYYESLMEQYPGIRVLTWESGFNYAAINNFAAREATGEYLLFLNNDMELITPQWLEELLREMQRPEVGMVGAKLYYPDEIIQHAGVIIGMGGVAGHMCCGLQRNDASHAGRAVTAQYLSAVTAACMLVKREVFEQVEGFDEEYQVAFNDIDICMKFQEAGYKIVFTPYVELYHYESKSRKQEDTEEKKARFLGETMRFHKKWPQILEEGDPNYNKNLTLKRSDFSLRTEEEDKDV
ncbi:MAG: glycosyltransferase family 2 protein [Lachnospiraceae bacterium]